MTEAIKFEVNEPVEGFLMYDEPKTGVNQHGTWYMYGLDTINNGETCFFATESLHSLLQKQNCKRRTKIKIVKQFKDGKNYFTVNGLSLGNMQESGFDSNGHYKPEEEKTHSDSRAEFSLETVHHKLDKMLIILKKLEVNEVPF